MVSPVTCQDRHGSFQGEDAGSQAECRGLHGSERQWMDAVLFRKRERRGRLLERTQSRLDLMDQL